MPDRGGRSLRESPLKLMGRAAATAAIRRALFRAGNALETRWKLVLKRPGSGRVYRHRFVTITRGGKSWIAPVEPRVPHQASAPGEPPASDTGRAAASVGVRDLPTATLEEAGKVRVATDAKYLRYLQDGVFDHPAGITIQPRPHADVAFREAEDTMRTVFQGELSRG